MDRYALIVRRVGTAMNGRFADEPASNVLHLSCVELLRVPKSPKKESLESSCRADAPTPEPEFPEVA